MLQDRDEKILKAVWYYRYMTSLDICRLFFSPKSLTHVREILAKLTKNQYLTRFELPSLDGRREKVYVLGQAGRSYLLRLGLDVSWSFRPQRLKFLSYSYVLHNLILTRTIIAASLWSQQNGIQLVDKKICYELEGEVIPDCWLLFHDNEDEIPVILEIDRGMEYQKKFKAHVKGRAEYLLRGYKEDFGTEAATVVYLTTGQTPEYTQTRKKTMERWTMQVLNELRLVGWEEVFKFYVVEYNSIYELSLFSELF
jgi:DNA-binding PadR family transcriptional regulator